jgi:hypothetical protein
MVICATDDSKKTRFRSRSDYKITHCALGGWLNYRLLNQAMPQHNRIWYLSRRCFLTETSLESDPILHNVPMMPQNLTARLQIMNYVSVSVHIRYEVSGRHKETRKYTITLSTSNSICLLVSFTTGKIKLLAKGGKTKTEVLPAGKTTMGFARKSL